jgi:hypothetical protein
LCVKWWVEGGLRLAGSHHRIARNDLIPDIFRFVSTISSLESLFNEAPSDIKYKLQLRCSFLLGLIGNDVLQTKDQDLTDELKIFEDLKDSYNARNDLLHGVGFRKVQKINIQKIIHYAKRSIICFYVLCDKLQPMTNKEQILNAIDKAILNHIEKDALKVKINEGLSEFVPNVPERFT